MSTIEAAVARIGRGLDIPLAGPPVQRIDAARPVTRVALLGVDHVGLRPRLEVAVGDEVLRGQALFVDRKEPSVRFVSPGAGRVTAIERGERRVLLSVVVELHEADRDPSTDAPAVELKAFRSPGPEGMSGDETEALLLESGLWTALRMRPFGRIPSPGTVPRSIFVTALDTNPHAPDLDVVLTGLEDELSAGLEALVKLGRGAPVRLCVRDGSALARAAVEGVAVHRFAGPHPAGLPGLHMNLIDPVGRDRVAWHLGAQDAVAIGALVRTGKLRLERVVSLGGAQVREPRLLRTRLGASIAELVEGELDGSKPARVVSGSVLHGHDAGAPGLGYLGRYHQQISAVPDEARRPLLGWMAPRLRESFGLDPLASRLLPGIRLALSTLMHGEPRPLIPIGRYERCMPYRDILPPMLFRALLCGDLDAAEELGALELEEEDLALCSFVCPSKIDFGRHLRAVLETLEKEGP